MADAVAFGSEELTNFSREFLRNFISSHEAVLSKLEPKYRALLKVLPSKLRMGDSGEVSFDSPDCTALWKILHNGNLQVQAFFVADKLNEAIAEALAGVL